MKIKTLAFTSLFTLLCNIPFADATDLDDLRVHYAEQMARIELANQQEEEAALNQYKASLTEAKDRYANAGNLTAVQEITKALDAIQAKAEVPAPGQEKNVINAAQWSYHTHMRKQHQALVEQKGRLIKGYALALDKQVQQLTRERKYEEAKKVKEELDEAKADLQLLAKGGNVQSSSSSQKPVEAGVPGRDGLLYYFSFDRPVDSEGEITDDSGRGHHGGAKGVRIIPTGRKGGSAMFEKDGDHINVDWFPAGSSYTLSAWIRSSSVKRQTLFEIGGMIAGAILYTKERRIYFGRRLSPGYYKQVEGPEVANGAWRHVAVVCHSNKEAMLYVDGKYQGSTPLKSGQKAKKPPVLGRSTDYNVYTKRRGSSDKYQFIGSMDEFMLFERSLSSDEVNALYLRP